MLSLNKRWVIGSAENVTLIFVFLFPCGWHSWAYWYFLFMSSFLHSRESYLNNILCAVFSNPNRLVDKHYQDWIHGSASQHSSFIQIPSVRDQLCVCQQPNLNLYEADAADKEKLRCPQVACREELACCDQGSLCVCVSEHLKYIHIMSLSVAGKIKISLFKWAYMSRMHPQFLE